MMSSTVTEVDSSNWEQEVSKSTRLTVVYFWHNQCPWCLRLTPIFNEVAEEYKGSIKFVKINVLEDPTNQNIATTFGIMSTPTLMFMCGGRPIGQIVGLLSKENLERGLNDMLLRHSLCINQSTQLKPSYVV